MEPHISDKKTIAERFGDKKLMQKRPVVNKKFSHVQKQVDTGKTIKDVKFLSDPYLSKRKNELFKRIKSSTLVKLIGENKNTESIYNLVDEPMMNNDGELSKPGQSVASFQTNRTGITTKTTVTAITYATEMLGNLSDIDFLLLDLRETSEYENYHIREAISFPGQNISRDKFLTQMINMKNKDGKLIILYGLDEKSSIPYASLLIQKGYDNIFMLNGGIEEFVNTYPEHCEGPMVDKLIAQKMMNDALRKQELAQKTTSKSFKTSLKTNTNDGLNSNKVISSNQSQYSGLSSNTKTTISTLKKNLKK